MATAPDQTRPVGIDYSRYPAPAPPAAADMATELDEFRRFLGWEMSRGVGNVSVDAVLAEFRLYQDEIRRMREALRPYEDRKARGEDTSVPWDLEAAKAEVTRRLAAKGIVDASPQG